jgi:hypothetical protein
MSKFSDLFSQLKDFEGETIQSVEAGETYEEEVHSISITFTNGSKLEVSPTSYNYGGQNLIVEIS